MANVKVYNMQGAEAPQSARFLSRMKFSALRYTPAQCTPSFAPI